MNNTHKTTAADVVKLISAIIVAIPFVYVIVSFEAFRWRHPWATSQEAVIHSYEALTWQTVKYEDMRAREGVTYP